MINGIRAFRCFPYVLITPDGIEYTTDVVSELCDELGIPLSTVTTNCHGRPIKKGRLKGWIIQKKERSISECASIN